MHHSGTSGWRWARTTWLAAVCAIGFLSPAVYGQGRDMGAGYCAKHGNYTGASCPKCAASGGTSGGRSVSPSDQLLLDSAGQLGTAIGSALHKKLFGDPAEKARQRAIAQESAIAAQREAEIAAVEAERKKQEDFNRLRGSLKLDSFDGDSGGGLLLKGVDVGSGGGLALKLGDDELMPQGTRAYANNGDGGANAPNTDPMVVDLRKAPSGLTRDSRGKLALKLGDDDVQPQVPTAPATAPKPEPAAQTEHAPEIEPETAPAPKPVPSPQPDIAPVPATNDEAAFALEPEPASPRASVTKTAPATAAKSDTVAVENAAAKTINILDRAVRSTLESLKTSQSGQSIEIDSELSEIKAMLNIPTSGKKGDHTVRTISFGHQQSGKSGDKQNVGQILVTRNEETGEVHIDVTQEQTGKAVMQNIIHIDRFGNIIVQESR